MVTVIFVILGLIWGVIYLITGKGVSHEEAGKTSLVIIDIIIFICCVVWGGSFGIMAGIIFCLIVDIVFIQAIVDTSTSQNVEKVKQQIAKEDKEHNNWGYIEWDEK